MANDFRSYLATVDKNALAYTGNDGRIDASKKGYDTNQGSYLNTGGNIATVQSYVSGLYNQWQKAQSAPTPQPTVIYNTPKPYVPKLANFDIMGNYTKARQTAETAVNPVYDRYLQEFLASQAASESAKRNEVSNTKAANALELSQGLAGNQVNRTRTGEDLTNSLAELTTQEGRMQQDTGTKFDTDRRAMAEDLASRGLVGSMGQGTMADAQTARNTDEGRQVTDFGNARSSKQLLASRTLDDLSRNDKDLQDIASNKDQGTDFDLESYLADEAGKTQQFRNDNELKRLQDVASQTDTYAKQGSTSFLQSLAGQGYNANDIALAYQMYA